MLFEHGAAEVCATSPGPEDLTVVADPERFVRWHLGQLSWARAVADGDFRLDGPRSLARGFPTWSRRSQFADVQPVRAPSIVGQPDR